MHRPTVVSLFSGCGGMDLGFLEAGFEIIWANDVDRHATASYARNIGNHIHTGDVTAIPSEEIPQADVVIGGFPCQGFSNAGSRRPDDPRNQLFWEMFRVIEAAQPRVFVGENVEGILTSRTPDGRNVMDVIVEQAARLGYTCRWQKLQAADYGAAQLRKRVIIVGAKDPRDIVFPEPTHGKTAGQPWRTLREVIGDLEELTPETPGHTLEESGLEDRDLLVAPHIPPGAKLCNVRQSGRAVCTWEIPDVYGQTTEEERYLLDVLARNRRKKQFFVYGKRSDGNPLPALVLAGLAGWTAAETERVIQSLVEKSYLVEKVPGCFDLKDSFNGLYRRMRWDEPSEAVITGFYRSRLYLHPSRNRPFSVRECLRIQGFPDTFTLEGPVKAQYTQVGNAVPVPLSAAVARTLRQQLWGDLLPTPPGPDRAGAGHRR